jgi:hydrogenase expression/formation protein HypC
MCLAIPGKVVATFEQGGMHMGKVQFGGITREACLEYVPETQVGDYVLVHVGFAISRIDEAEAERTYEALRQLDQLTELESPPVEEFEPIKVSGSIDPNDLIDVNTPLEPVLHPSELP